MNISGRVGSSRRSQEASAQMRDYETSVKKVTQGWVADTHRKASYR